MPDHATHPEVRPLDAEGVEISEALPGDPLQRAAAKTDASSFLIGAVIALISNAMMVWLIIQRVTPTLPQAFLVFGFAQLLYTLPCAGVLLWMGQRRMAGGVLSVALLTALVWPVLVAIVGIGTSIYEISDAARSW